MQAMNNFFIELGEHTGCCIKDRKGLYRQMRGGKEEREKKREEDEREGEEREPTSKHPQL